MVTSKAATVGEKELKTDWPIEEGLTAGTTKQEGTKAHLQAEKSLVLEEEKWGSL